LRRGGSWAGNRDNIARVEGLRRRWSSALTVALLATTTAAPAQAAGGSWRPAGPARPASLLASRAPSRAAGDTAPAAVVGLDADAPEQGAALTRALRRSFAARGLSGGEEVTLSELRLALGCKVASPECLSRGGSLLGARRLIYGSLRRSTAGGWSLEVTLVEADDGGAATTVDLALTDADLAGDRVSATAELVADRLAPDTSVSPTPEQGRGGRAPPPPPPPPPERSDDGDDAVPGDGRLRWGWVRPQPRWKWAGFGVGAGSTVVGFSVALGTGLWLTRPNAGFRQELLDAAEASLNDENELNDIDPNLPATINLCEFARERPLDENGQPLGMPGQVRNTDVVQVCNRAETIRRGQVISTVVGSVGLATTVVFTILLFVHREPARASTWRRRGMIVGLDPVRGEGVSLRVGGRF
jgi:hypothetical protein